MSDPSSTSVLVLLGTDHHPFDRLLGWVEDWLASHGPDAPSVLVQHGFSSAPDSSAARARYTPFLDHHEITDRLSRACAAVCHGGPGTIAECRRAGLVPVVVPRSAAHGEHVDNHQVRYVGRLDSDALVHAVSEEGEFRIELEAALGRPRATLTEIDESTVGATVSRFGDLVAAALNDAGRRGRLCHTGSGRG